MTQGLTLGSGKIPDGYRPPKLEEKGKFGKTFSFYFPLFYVGWIVSKEQYVFFLNNHF